MTERPSSRSSSRAPSVHDPDPSSSFSSTASSTTPSAVRDTPSTTNPASLSSSTVAIATKRDAAHYSRASAAPRSNLSTSGPLSGHHSLHSSRSPSLAASPRNSRDPSPASLAFRHSSAGNAMNPRARKNSIEVSPQRAQTNAPVTPSAAAIQRALSRDTAPQLQPSTTTESNIRVARSTKPSGANGSVDGKDTPSWPISPRLRSPPSSSPRRSAARGSKRQEDNLSLDGTVRRKSPDSLVDITNQAPAQSSKAPVSRAPNSSAPYLETVQESSVPPTPVEESSRESSRERKHEYFSFDSSNMSENRPSTARQESTDSLDQLTPKASHSTSKTVIKDDAANADAETTPKSKLLSRESPSKTDVKTAAEPVSKNMTVETETVSSIPQATLAPSTDRSISGKSELGGTLRVKASTETIRPRKERKKATKKTPSVNAGSSSTRADIFEDRVKNAMDEATSDDSDETFVYESNPPDPPPGRSRHHSRTPSGASLSSMPDRTVMRSIANALENQRTVPKARSMKFASNASNYGTADEDLDNNGTVRASNRGGHSAIQHHFRGQQRNTNSQYLAVDDDTNVVPLSKTKSLTAVGGRGSYAARLAAQNLRHSGTIKRSDGYMSLDIEAEAADDERTPLVGGTIRTPRGNNRSLRGRPRMYEPAYLRRDQPRSLMSRFAGCFLILSTLSILIFGVVCFLFEMSKPLSKVAIVELKSIIASEQELMLDVVFQAVNPNLVPITIMELDVNMFARSKYAGIESLPAQSEASVRAASLDAAKRNTTLRRQRMTATSELVKADLGDSPTDPKKPTAGQTLLLGEILHFDNPLSFDGSFWRKQLQFSTASIRLSKPGNHTEAGGTERWEHVLEHDFDLIIRGILRYAIPLGGRTVNVPIDGEQAIKGNGSKHEDDDPASKELATG